MAAAPGLTFWGKTRAFIVKVRPPMMMTNQRGYPQIKEGALRVGVFEKTETGWIINNKFLYPMDASSLGELLVPERQEWAFQAKGRAVEATPDQQQQPGQPGAEVLLKHLHFQENAKSSVIHATLQVFDANSKETLHNVSTDLTLGNWYAFREIARASIPLILGFDANTFAAASRQ
jgi:hypothetical protein